VSGGGTTTGKGGASTCSGGRSAAAAPATNTPSRSRGSTTPRAISSSYAACTVFFEIPSCCSSTRTGGSRLPAGSAPDEISRPTLATMSAALARRPAGSTRILTYGARMPR
jgi:hypothetical protein